MEKQIFAVKYTIPLDFELYWNYNDDCFREISSSLEPDFYKIEGGSVGVLNEEGHEIQSFKIKNGNTYYIYFQTHNYDRS